jgi:hypothetical protein
LQRASRFAGLHYLIEHPAAIKGKPRAMLLAKCLRVSCVFFIPYMEPGESVGDGNACTRIFDVASFDDCPTITKQLT